jgi:hypothetical protein
MGNKQQKLEDKIDQLVANNTALVNCTSKLSDEGDLQHKIEEKNTIIIQRDITIAQKDTTITQHEATITQHEATITQQLSEKKNSGWHEMWSFNATVPHLVKVECESGYITDLYITQKDDYVSNIGIISSGNPGHIYWMSTPDLSESERPTLVSETGFKSIRYLVDGYLKSLEVGTLVNFSENLLGITCVKSGDKLYHPIFKSNGVVPHLAALITDPGPTYIRRTTPYQLHTNSNLFEDDIKKKTEVHYYKETGTGVTIHFGSEDYEWASLDYTTELEAQEAWPLLYPIYQRIYTTRPAIIPPLTPAEIKDRTGVVYYYKENGTFHFCDETNTLYTTKDIQTEFPLLSPQLVSFTQSTKTKPTFTTIETISHESALVGDYFYWFDYTNNSGKIYLCITEEGTEGYEIQTHANSLPTTSFTTSRFPVLSTKRFYINLPDNVNFDSITAGVQEVTVESDLPSGLYGYRVVGGNVLFYGITDNHVLYWSKIDWIQKPIQSSKR